MLRRLPPVAWVDLAAKVALILLLLHAVAFPDLPQYFEKGIGTRLVTYPISTILVPVVWLALGRRRAGWRYPWLLDLCVVAPFLIDTAGNAANLYNTIDWWDDVMHAVTWIPWVTGFGLLLRYGKRPKLDLFGLTAGFGAVTHILWEVFEYLSFVRGNPTEAATAYQDTIGDLCLSLSGSFVGAALVATVLYELSEPQRRLLS